MTTPSEPQAAVSRRDFLKLAWSFFGGLALLEAAGMFVAYLQPRLTEGEFGARIVAGAADDFPPGSVTHLPEARAYLVRLADGGFLAIYQRCTHLGCSVPWDPAAGRFVCPCHNSQFDQVGQVQSPPAPRPLDLFPVTIAGGQVLIDTGKPVAREAFNVSQVVYP